MSPRSAAATALAAATLPLVAAAALWRSAALQRRALWADLDPFEIDLQLTERNDA
jgi:hypothetical protein